jgi:hypothetical protein
MTIKAIAQRAEVSAQNRYAVFRSGAGILAEILGSGRDWLLEARLQP